MSGFSEADFMHEKGTEPNWQESVLLFFHDEKTGVSGYSRLGIEPNAEACQEWIYLQDAEGRRFRRLRHGLPHSENSRRPDGFSSGGLNWTYEGDCIHFTAAYPEAQVDLRYRDFYPSTYCWKWIGAEDVKIGAAGHYESSGYLRGTVTIDGNRYNIERALSHRDHSWGARDGSNMRVSRWCVGSIGPELSHCALSYIDKEGNMALGGWVVREGEVTHASALDFVVQSNMDGLTIRGGTMVMTLEDNSVVEVRAETVANFITAHNSERGGHPGAYICSEGVSRSFINGKQGVCCYTTCNNIAGLGERANFVLDEYSTLQDGLSRRGQNG